MEKGRRSLPVRDKTARGLVSEEIAWYPVPRTRQKEKEIDAVIA